MGDWMQGRENKGRFLSGKKQITSFVSRSWRTVSFWIAEKEFPAVKIDGIWESHTDLIEQWRFRQINQNGDRGQ